MVKSTYLPSLNYLKNNYKIRDSSEYFVLSTAPTTTKNFDVDYVFNKIRQVHKTEENFPQKRNYRGYLVNNTNFNRSHLLNFDYRLNKPISDQKQRLIYMPKQQTKSTNKNSIENLRRFDSNKIFHLQKPDVCINFKIYLLILKEK